MMIHDVTSQTPARPRRKRLGRGESSGKGKTCGRGTKGAQSRAGWRTDFLYAGGQLPIYRRVQKRGFNNFNFRTEFCPVSLDLLQLVAPQRPQLGIDDLRELAGVRPDEFIKILSGGELTARISVEAHAFSAAAKSAIEKAGGTATIIARRDSAALAKAKRRTAKNRPRPARPERTIKKAGPAT